MNTIRDHIRIFRISHWIKNSFLFIPSFFAGNIFDPDHLLQLGIAFMCFNFVASSVYIVNDARDLEVDRIHPVKKNRPFASGKVKVSTGLALMSLTLLVGLGGAYLLNINFFYLVMAYLTINLAYSIGLKKVPILDLMIVSAGFIIRIHSGGVVSEVPVSHWLSIMIFLLSLFLILTKRLDDIRIYEEDGTILRSSTRSYNKDFIHACITMIGGIIIVAYILYTVSPEIAQKWGSEYIYVTTIFVLAGVMRYLQVTMVELKSGSPVSILYKDKFIIFTLIGWATAFFFIIYY